MLIGRWESLLPTNHYIINIKDNIRKNKFELFEKKGEILLFFSPSFLSHTDPVYIHSILVPDLKWIWVATKYFDSIVILSLYADPLSFRPSNMTKYDEFTYIGQQRHSLLIIFTCKQGQRWNLHFSTRKTRNLWYLQIDLYQQVHYVYKDYRDTNRILYSIEMMNSLILIKMFIITLRQWTPSKIQTSTILISRQSSAKRKLNEYSFDHSELSWL